MLGLTELALSLLCVSAAGGKDEVHRRVAETQRP